LGRFVRALDHGNGALPLVRVFQLVAEVLRVAEIDLRPDAGVAQLGGHRLVLGHPLAVHDGDDDGPLMGAADPPLGAQRGEEAVDPDGDAGGRHLLPRETLHEVVVAPAARDGAELAGTALLVGDLEGKFGLVDGAGVVAEATHDGGVDHDAVGTVALGGEQVERNLQ
jgi:hypothetical protein